MGYNAKVLADSISCDGVRLTTLEVVIPRLVLSEFNTHRMLSRNSASSRAIPVEKKIAAVKTDPFIPSAFGKNRSGMQSDEDLDGSAAKAAKKIWLRAMRNAIKNASLLAQTGVHKQLANRLIEPYSWQTIIVSATEWENYFALRCNDAAQAEIRIPSEAMRHAMSLSQPERAQVHLPLVPDRVDLVTAGFSMSDLMKISVGRCARVSYLTHDGNRDPYADIALCERLMTSGHMSPFEHVATPLTGQPQTFCGNFRGWLQFRKTLLHEANFANVVAEGAT